MMIDKCSQSHKFKDLARELDAHEDEAFWDDRLTKVARDKPVEEKPE
jgi:hypothetical protein